MTETASHPKPEILRQLSTLRDMPQDELEALSKKLCVHEDRSGAVLLQIGATDEFTLYLLEGRCRLIAEDGAVKIISHTDRSATAPLARLRPSHYKVVAESRVRYLRIDNAYIKQKVGRIDQPSALTLQNYQVEEEDDLAHLDAENRLTLQIYEDLNAESLMLPSLPQVAIEIGEAVNAEDADARKIAALIETDPAIALKIVKAANSARYGGISQVVTVAEAVARLGMQNTRFLVVSFALRELFRTNSRQLEKRMQALWEHSRRIGALAEVLAARVGHFNTHEALLAGLVHDIGVVAVLGYARDFPEVVDSPDALESSISALRTQLSGMILAKWDMPAELVTAAKEAENWYRRHPGRPDYADLVIAAQLHEGIGAEIDPAQVPALVALGLTNAEIDEGLSELDDPDEDLVAAKRLLTG
jgi:HD-like signal output (HDOD) protein